MKTLSDFLTDSQDQLNEVAIQFGRKAYPKFGQVVILAGGAGSGKGFLKDRLLSIEGLTFDTDQLKSLAAASTAFAAKVKSETGVDLKKVDLRKPENVSQLHQILGGVYKLDQKFRNTALRSVLEADPRRKPNLIFDVTLKDMIKVKTLSEAVQRVGYEKENIHIVWIVNSIEVAMKQNMSRDRVVSSDVLMATHEGAALTMKKLITMGERLGQYMDGDIFIAFNKVGVDTDLQKSGRGGSYIAKQNYVHVKQKGKPTDLGMLSTQINNKIVAYVPKTQVWKNQPQDTA